MIKRKNDMLLFWLTGALFCVAVDSIFSYSPNPAQSAIQQVNWPEISTQAWAENFERPVVITHAADDSERIFVVEQPGRIMIIENGLVNPVPFLDIQEQVKCCGEEGLLGLAFPPEYAEKGHFYVYYTRLDGNNQVSRFFTSSDANIVDPDSEEEILFLHHPSYSNHNGGQLAFGPDGYLYIGTGDGGGSGDPEDNAQSLASLLGKILRIDVENAHSTPIMGDFWFYIPLLAVGNDLPARAYTLPPDNPFLTEAQAQPEIWALGLRNPWRFSFDRSTGDLYLADVGQSLREEVNFQPASSTGAENYGWNILEGSLCYSPSTGCIPPLNYVPPVAEYDHSLGCSITGGEVYRGSEYPTLQGIYLYADFCSGRLWGLVNDGSGWQTQELLDTTFQISTFGSDENGNLYLADLNAGQIYRIVVNP
jgi:glucose/arabinose dehydrogenase